MKLEKIIKNILISILPFIFSTLIGYFFSNSTSIKKNVLASSIAQISKTNDNNLSYVKYSSANTKSGLNQTRECYKSLFKYNFLNCIQTLTYCNSESNNSKFYLGVDGLQFNQTFSAIDAVYYSTQEKLCRFETLKLNLYRFRERAEETFYSGKDCEGFAYIPDFVADKILEFNNLDSYDDLFTTNENKFYLTTTHEDGTLHKYKISNVFKVNGFNKKYCSKEIELIDNDDNCGRLIQTFIGDFFVLFDPQLISTNNFVINSLIKPKKYSIIEYVTLTTSIDKNYRTSGEFYSFTEDEKKIIDDSSFLFSAFYEKYSLSGKQIVALVFACAGIFIFILSSYLLFIKYDGLTIIFHSIILSLILVLVLIINILKIFITNVAFNSLFCSPFMISIFMSFIYIVVLFLYEVKKSYGFSVKIQ